MHFNLCGFMGVYLNQTSHIVKTQLQYVRVNADNMYFESQCNALLAMV